MNRRDLLRRGFAFAAASAIPAALPFTFGAETHRPASTAVQQPQFKPRLLDIHTFESLKGQTFQLYRDGSSLDPILTLVDVNLLASAAGRKTQTFNLRFYGGPQEMLPQGTYNIHNAYLGTFRLFIVPEAKNTRDYFATFTRLVR